MDSTTPTPAALRAPRLQLTGNGARPSPFYISNTLPPPGPDSTSLVVRSGHYRWSPAYANGETTPLRVGGADWAISLAEGDIIDVRDQGKCWAICCGNRRLIVVSTDPQGADRIECVWHELAHAICFEMAGFTERDSIPFEQVAQIFGHAMQTYDSRTIRRIERYLDGPEGGAR